MRRGYMPARSRSLRCYSRRVRLRYFITAAIILLLFYSFSATSSGYLPFDRYRPHRIQASFPRETPASRSIRLKRREKVKKAFEHAWKGYKEHAWLHDEVRPLSGGHKDGYAGWAATLVDSLDSLYILDLQDEFAEALSALEGINFSQPHAEQVPVFEVSIRYLGGLLGAWDVSGHQHPILLEKAKQLGDFLYKAFNTENGVPVPYYDWQQPSTGKLPGEKRVIIAQIGSLSMEFIRLSQVTGDTKYADAIQLITNQLEWTQNSTTLPGIWPSQVDTGGPNISFTSQSYTLGAFADSLFEYLPKTHLLVFPSDQYLNMYRAALATFSKHLIFRPALPGDPDILFSGSVSTRSGKPKLEPQVQHLGCFVGGMVALGSKLIDSREDLEVAGKLTDGCVWAYNNTPSGIMPEVFNVEDCVDPTSCKWDGDSDKNGFRSIIDSSYQLRPEAIESVFVMYRLTGDPSWQDKGWGMFEAIVNHTTTDIANARIKNVMDPNPEADDSMESFWLAETLKYFYLLFSEPDLVSLDHFVLNTEAHPLKWERALL